MALIDHYIDPSIVVVEKPAGLPAVPGRTPALQDCLWRRLQARWPDALVVHRLDMATSGLMVFARGVQAQRALGKAFAERRVRKRYVAVVSGRLEGRGEIDLPLGADWPNRPKKKVDRERGKPSLTRWHALAQEGVTSRLELEPVTGRSHQLRVHLLGIGHPIVGDELYAPEVAPAAGRLLLHAAGLAFEHPHTGQTLTFQSTPPF
ncbi:MAG TPA: RluA family pseudouridine synthase [Burkholderiaceae bacterium]|nr:RluA family pseudouridine synthase [Burkholderiaceae bacterium]